MRLLVSCYIFFIAAPVLCYGQHKITGSVKDYQKKPIINGTISLKKDNVILKYTKTDENGIYTLQIDIIENENYSIEAKCFGYKTAQEAYKPNQNNYDFMLYENAINLDSVTVKHKPVIIQRGDTLNYRTADFANADDRSIGDVLKKMPGITVDDNGKISYQNQAISNLYIDGDNLLDDKYNIGTKSIPHKAVTKIQVIDHDQPIKMLQKNNNSTDVAINLVIDKNAKLKIMGNAKVGVGIPGRFDENIDVMLFKQNIKFLDNITLNNIGTDISDDVISHNNALNINRYENNRPDFQLGTGVGVTPYLPKSRHLFNNSGIVNTNNLYKINAEKQLKANVYYLYDQRRQNTNYQTQIQLPNETITYAEQQYNRAISQSIYAQFNYIDNASTLYTNNNFRADYSPDKNNADISSTLPPFTQHLSQKRLNLVNDLKYLRELKSGSILNLNSYIEKNNQTELLNIAPGINANILNSGVDYSQLIQQISIPGFFTNNYISYGIQKGNFTTSYQAGFSYQNLDYNSGLDKQQSNTTTEQADNGQNNVDWNRFKAYFSPALDYKTQVLRINIQLPLSFNSLKYNGSQSSFTKLFANPSLSFQYIPTQQTKINASYSFSQSMGGIGAIFSGIVLQNYRSLVANEIPLPFTKTHRTSVGFNYQQPISMLFFNIKVSHNRSIYDNIMESMISNSIIVRNAIPYHNNIDNYMLSGSIGKYIIDLNTNLSFDVALGKSTGEQFQNNYIFPYSNENLGFGINVSTKITQDINWILRSTYSNFSNFFNDIKGGELVQLRQFSNVNATIFKKIVVGLNLNHIYVQQGEQKDLNYLFADVNLKYKWAKLKTDLEFGLNNIANIKTFSTYFIDANSFTSSSYHIPGRYALLRAIFAFN